MKKTVRPLLTLALVVLCLLLVAGAAPAAGAASGLLWTDRYVGTPEIDQWNDVAIGPDHTVYVCGSQGLTQGPGANIMVAKYGPGGSRLWQNLLFDGIVLWDGGSDYAQGDALAVDRDGDVVVAGSTATATGGFALVKLSGVDGHILWSKDVRLVGAAWARDVAVDKYRNIYVTGTMEGGMSVGTAIVTRKYSSDGHKRWEDIYSGPLLSSDARSLALDGSRNVYVIGSTQSTTGGTDWVTMRISPTGDRKWARRWDGLAHGQDWLAGLVVPATGGAFVAGSTQTADINRDDAVVVRYGQNGKRLWTRQITKTGSTTYVSDLAMDSGGNLLLCGNRRPVGANDPVHGFLAKVSATGAKRWTRDLASFGNPAGDMPFFAIVAGPSGSMYLAGSVEPSDTDDDCLIEKRNSYGTIQWRAIYGWQEGDDDLASPLALDGSRGLYVCEHLASATTFIDAGLQKYRP
jgi:hypothetical protein